MASILLTQQSYDRTTTSAGRGLSDQFVMMYRSLSQDVIQCKRILQDLIVHRNVQEKIYLSRMLVKANKKLIIISVDKIYWIEAWGDYIRLHCNEKCHLVRQKIYNVESRLDPYRFLRINRSAIINIDHIKELEPMNHGDYLVTLNGDTQLNLSRNYRDRLFVLFDNHL